jgi:hypothetical protein
MLNWVSKEFLIAVCGALAIALISLWPLLPYETSQTPKVETKQQSDRGQESQQNADASITDRRGDNASHGSEEASEYWTLLHRRLKITDTLLVVFTFTLWWSTRGLVNEAKDSSQRQLRAYISVDPKLVFNWAHKTFVLAISFHIHNHGQTPGTEILHEFSMDILDSPLPSALSFEGLMFRYDQNTTLFPKAEVPVRLTFNRLLTSQETSDVELGKRRFHIWGVMSYRDAFDEPRTTRYSFSFGGPNFASGMKNIPGATWSWEHGPNHNDAT